MKITRAYLIELKLSDLMQYLYDTKALPEAATKTANDYVIVQVEQSDAETIMIEMEEKL